MTDAPVKLCFGPYVIDMQARELRKGNARLKLHPQSFEILVVLAERAGQVVTRDDLRTRLWPEDTFVDFEHSVNTAINKVRLALHDSAEEPRFIETIPRRGYRFIAPLEAVATGGETVPAAPSDARSRLRLLAIVASAVVLLVGAGVAIFRYDRTPPLTERDSILITGVVNRTGDPLFEDTLRTALEVSLEQSPYLNVVPDRKVRETLRLMAKPPDTPLTEDIAREICQRDGIKAMLGGSIADFGRKYAITLRAVNATSGDTLAEELVEANSKEEVLSALGEAATALRRKLGESLSSVQKFTAPLPRATTSSLDALKAYSLGMAQYAKDDDSSAAALFKRAVDLDPDFADAYAALGGARGRMGEVGQSKEAMRKAYALRNRATEREKLDITCAYYQSTWQVNRAVQTCQLWKEIYPRDFRPFKRLGFEYATLGRWKDSAKEFGEANHLDPAQYLPYAGLIEAYIALNRPSDARATYRQAKGRKLGSGDLEKYRYRFAFLDGDYRTLTKVAASFHGEPDFESMEASTEAYYGCLDKSQKMWRHATNEALREGHKGLAGSFDAKAALVQALFGTVTIARRNARAALSLFVGSSRSWGRAEAILALALAGDSARAGKLADKLARDYPDDMVLNNLWLPEIRSVIKLKEGKDESGVDALVPATAYELGWTSPPLLSAYLRGQAYLSAGRGPEASKEFQRILDHRGLVFNAPDGSLAYLGLGRAYALEAAMARGDQAVSFRAKACTAYQEFFELWTDADPTIPILRQAKAEYARLK